MANCIYKYKGKDYTKEEFYSLVSSSNFIQQEQVKKFTELQERLNNKEFLEGAKNAFESSEELQEWGTQEQYNDFIARVSLGIIKNPTSGGYNYESQVKDIVYHGITSKLKEKFDRFSKEFIKSGQGRYGEDGFFFSENKEEVNKNYNSSGLITAIINLKNTSKDIYKNTWKETVEYLTEPQEIYGGKTDLDYLSDGYRAAAWYKEGNWKKQVEKLKEDGWKIEETANSYIKLGKISSQEKTYYSHLKKNLEKGTLPFNVNNSVKAIRKAKEQGLDGLIYENVLEESSVDKHNQYVVFEPEQIHILGSKQDIEGFKEFVQEEKDDLNPFIDEYDNTWNELSINQARDLSNVLLQKNRKGQIVGQAQFNPNASFMAGKVLIDYINGTVDTVPHEYAHLYIAWFRNTPLVQEAIRQWGSEEALVQAIGEQAVVQKGKAWTWWKKFVAWLLNSANELSDLSRENLRDILTDAFLSRQDITATLGGDVYKKDQTSGEWIGVDPDNTIVYPSDAVFKAALDAEQADKVKNDATMDFYPEKFDKMKAEGRIEFKNMYGDAKIYYYNKNNETWYDVAVDNRTSSKTTIDDIENEWDSAAEAADNYSWENNTMLQLQNKQLNTHKSIALNRVNRYNLLATINTSITNDITSTLDISAKQKNSGAVIDPKTNIIAAITMVGSKQGVGNMANAISGRSLLMPINAHTEPSFYYSVGDENIRNKELPIYLAPFGITEESFINDEGEEDSAYSFGSLIDSQIRSVMFHLSEYLTLQVDAVKDPVAVALGYIKANLNLVSYLSSLGVTPEKIAQFLAEPGSSGTQVNRNNIITVWHDTTESNENSFHKGKFFKTYTPSDYEGRQGYTTTTFTEKSNYKLKLEFVDAELKKNSTYKGIDVKEAYINQIVDGDRKLAYHLNYAAIIRDNVDLLKHPVLKILYYWDLIEQAKQYAKSVKIINADGHHSKSMNNAVEHQNNVREQIENPIASVIRTSDLKKIISGDQSIVSGFFNAQKKYEEYFKKYFFSYERNIAPQLNAALKDRYNKSSEDDLTRLMSNAHNDFLVYLFFRMQNIDPSLSNILAKDDDGNILTPEELMYSDNDNPSEVSKLYTALINISKSKNSKGTAVDPKYSGITRSTAVMLLKLLDIQLNITDAKLLKDGRGADTQSTLVDLVKLGEKISSASTVNKYIEMFEELRNHSPEVFKIFTSLSLFQSGISNSPYNLFKGMPNTTKAKDGIIDILAKTVIAYDKFIANSISNNIIEAPQGWTPNQVATTALINDFLRWYDVQYGSYLLEGDRKAYYSSSKVYRKFNPSTLKYEVRVKKDGKPNKNDNTVFMGRSSYVKEFFKNVDNTYTISEVQNIEEDAVTALGALERYAKALIEANIEVSKLCQ